jgi:hypothetical protein
MERPAPVPVEGCDSPADGHEDLLDEVWRILAQFTAQSTAPAPTEY